MLARLTMLLFGAAALAAAVSAAPAEKNWANWRGPNYDGSAQAAGLPVDFSTSKGVRWATALPGPSAATPAIWGDRVFVSAADLEKEQLLALCLDRTTGKILWQQNAGSGYQPEGLGSPVSLDSRSNYASPSPVTDGKHAVFFYGNGDMVTYDFAGTRIWTRNLQKDYGDFCFGWTFSSTPQLYDGLLYMQILQRDIPVDGRGRNGSESFLMALDPATGKELWRVARPSPAKMESREAFTTPIPYEHEGRKQILLAGGDLLSGHDPATGRELWRWGTWNRGHNHPTMRLVPSPVAGAGVVLACAPKNFPVYAVPTSVQGDRTDQPPMWSSPERSPVTSDVPTPLFYKGSFYVLSDLQKAISRVKPDTGEVLWTTDLPGTSRCWASPTGADEKLYLLSLTGEVYVLDAETGKILATNPMAQDQNEIRSSIAVAHDDLFIRTNTHLYCVAGGK